jgi:hypothetical protein
MWLNFSVKDLQYQITQVESECERLSRLLESQKLVTADIEAAAARRMDDISKEIQTKVSFQSPRKAFNSLIKLCSGF